MNRQDRDRYDYGSDYSGYGDYRNDRNYHSARNLSDQFEREYQQDRGRWDDDRNQYQPHRSYHEGDMGGEYERLSRERGRVRGDTSYDMMSIGHDRDYFENQNRDRDRYSNYQDDYRSYQGMGNSGRNRGGDRDRSMGQDNLRQGYGISSFAGTSDRYNTLGNDQNRGGAEDRSYYSGSRGGYRSGGYGGGSMGESFPGSNRGVPDTTYGMGNFSENEGTGMGSTYGGRNYGGGTGYSEGHRGGSFGNQTFGSSSGNYGGSSSMGGGSYGGRSSSGRGDTSHNSDRGTRELGGF